jgi:primosomal protein N' (replication factor Y)
MLTQVAGRSGRAKEAGKVIIQTYQPEHPVLRVLRGEISRSNFLEEERLLRKEVGYPPFLRLCKIRIQNSKSEVAAKQADQLSEFLSAKALTEGEVTLLGPSEAYLSRLKGLFRYDLILKSRDYRSLYRALSLAKQWSEKFDIPLILDVDPYSLS